MTTDKTAEILLNKLCVSGFEAYIVGGCVRDALLGLKPHDCDICTNALPNEIKRIFADYNTVDTGIKHGTVAVIADGAPYEITTYRIDGNYFDNRHPDAVTFTPCLAEDLKRRDFTINAMAYNHKNGLVDPLGGREDLKNRLVRCVGNPDNRFNEDALRILRALRFASTYGFKIEHSTSEAILRNAHLLKNIAAERISAELLKLLCGKFAEKILDEYRAVIAVLIPEVSVMFDYDQQNIYHSLDLWHHSLRALSECPPDALLRTVMLLHDVGKPSACIAGEDGQRHFWGHQAKSKSIAEEILIRLKLPSDFIDDCLLLIEYHDIRFNGSKKLVKKVLNVLGERLFYMLLSVQRADIKAQSEYHMSEKLGYLELAKKHLDEVINNNECFNLSKLALDGNDIMSLGVKEGKEVGAVLNHLLTLVIDENTENDRAELTEKAIEYISALDAGQK